MSYRRVMKQSAPCGCSMGGILVKEMLVKSMQPGAPARHARLRRQTRGLAFYATPHHGSWLADVGWNLRFLGASPAASVVHLKRGPQQEVPALPVALQGQEPVVVYTQRRRSECMTALLWQSNAACCDGPVHKWHSLSWLITSRCCICESTEGARRNFCARVGLC